MLHRSEHLLAPLRVQLPPHCGPDETHQTDISSISRHNSHSNFCLADLSLLAGNPDIAGQGNLTTSS